MNQMNRVVPALPTSTEELLAMRKAMRERTLNDHVDDIHVTLWSDPEYRRALDAVQDKDAIEGSLSADNFLAAGMIRRHAIESKNPFVRDQKLATIVKSLNIVLRRYGIARRERALNVTSELFEGGNRE